jgi:hypothetical protein
MTLESQDKANWSPGQAWAALATYLVGFLVLSWPAALSFSTHFIGDDGDGVQNAWNLWWIGKAVSARHSLWFTTYLFYPDGVTLAGHTLAPFNGFLGMALSSLLTAVQTYNVVVTFAFVGSGFTFFLLARDTGASFAGSLFGGAAFTFANYHWAHAQGHMNLISLEWLPLFALLWLRWLDKPRLRYAAGAACVLLLAALCSYDYLQYALLLAAIFLGGQLWRSGPRAFIGDRARVRSLAVFCALVLVTSGLLIAQVLVAYARDRFTTHDPTAFSLDLLALFVPGAHWRFATLTRSYWEALPSGTVEGCVYLGWTTMAAATCGWRAKGHVLRFWGWLIVTFGILALGPELQVAGLRTGVPLPYALLEAAFPPMRLSGPPVRMASMVLFGTALLASHGFPVLIGARRRKWLMGLAFVSLFLLETWPSPVPLTHLSPPDDVRALQRLPMGAVHVVNMEDTWLYYQTLFEKPLSWGYISRLPESLSTRQQELDALAAAGRHREIIDHWGIRYVVAAPSGTQPPAGLRPVFRGAARTIYVASDDPCTMDTGDRIR